MWGIVHLLADPNAGETFKQDAITIVGWIMTIAGTLLTVYAIFIAYLFATATDAAKRSAAKKRLMTIFSSALCIYALALCLKVIDVKFIDVGGGTGSGLQGGQGNSGSGLDLMDGTFTYGMDNIMYPQNKEQFFNTQSKTVVIEVDANQIMKDASILVGGAHAMASDIKILSFAFDSGYVDGVCELEFGAEQGLKAAWICYTNSGTVKYYRYKLGNDPILLVPCSISLNVKKQYAVVKTWLCVGTPQGYNQIYFPRVDAGLLNSTAR